MLGHSYNKRDLRLNGLFNGQSSLLSSHIYCCSIWLQLLFGLMNLSVSYIANGTAMASRKLGVLTHGSD